MKVSEIVGNMIDEIRDEINGGPLMERGGLKVMFDQNGQKYILVDKPKGKLVAYPANYYRIRSHSGSGFGNFLLRLTNAGLDQIQTWLNSWIIISPYPHNNSLYFYGSSRNFQGRFFLFIQRKLFLDYQIKFTYSYLQYFIFN